MIYLPAENIDKAGHCIIKGLLMKYFFTTLSLLLITALSASAQRIDSTIAIYAERYGQEKAYLHYDKASYAPGETIWFKAYLMTGILPADESKTFYVDWTDGQGRLLSHGAFPIVDASTNGQFEVPADYVGDFIHVKAYTKWMLNFDSAFLYNKDIRILSKKPSPQSVAKTVIVPALQLFPEGGDLIAEVSNKIAFKANDQWGRPVKIKGVVTDSKGQRVDSLRTLHDGMGFFYIRPARGETYTARWKDEKGKDYTTTLPVVKANGISMQLSLADDKRTIIANASAAYGASLQTIHLVGTMNQNLAFNVSKDISSGSTRIIVPTQGLPTGILTVTIFDNQWAPLAERITFINNNEYRFEPEINVDHWGLSPRARNKIDIILPDSLPANLSVSVTDVNIDADSSDNIFSHLLLTSDIKGQVYRPAYYFSANTELIRQHLDLVMLTHGWRRFKWEDVIKGKLPAISYPKDTAYLSLSGKIYGASSTQLRDAGDIILLVKPSKGESQTMLLPVDKDGVFSDPNLVLFDSLRVYYQLSKKKGLGDASVRFMENRLPPLSSSKAANGLFNSHWDTTGFARHWSLADETTKAIQLYEGKTLDNIVIKSKAKSKLEVMDEKYTSALFRGDAVQFDLTDDMSAQAAMSVFNYLQGRVAGLQINTSGGTPTLTWRGGSPSLYIDEMQTNTDVVSSMPMSDIAYIKVFRPPFTGGFGGSGGAIAIYTRRGDDIKSEPGKGLANNIAVGYSGLREFYSPNYDTFKKENEKKDLRTTLYWNPQARTDVRSNKISLTFYNNDISESFRVVIEGMSPDGRLAHLEQIME